MLSIMSFMGSDFRQIIIHRNEGAIKHPHSYYTKQNSLAINSKVDNLYNQSIILSAISIFSYFLF